MPECKFSCYVTEHLTITEQLFPFGGELSLGGKCMPSNRTKFDLEVFWLCDASNAYSLKGILSRGKQAIIKYLAEKYTDGFFTTVPLAHALSSCKLAIVGTLKKKSPIP